MTHDESATTATHINDSIYTSLWNTIGESCKLLPHLLGRQHPNTILLPSDLYVNNGSRDHRLQATAMMMHSFAKDQEWSDMSLSIGDPIIHELWLVAWLLQNGAVNQLTLDSFLLDPELYLWLRDQAGVSRTSRLHRAWTDFWEPFDLHDHPPTLRHLYEPFLRRHLTTQFDFWESFHSDPSCTWTRILSAVTDDSPHVHAFVEYLWYTVSLHVSQGQMPPLWTRRLDLLKAVRLLVHTASQTLIGFIVYASGDDSPCIHLELLSVYQRHLSERQTSRWLQMAYPVEPVVWLPSLACGVFLNRIDAWIPRDVCLKEWYCTTSIPEARLMLNDRVQVHGRMEEDMFLFDMVGPVQCLRQPSIEMAVTSHGSMECLRMTCIQTMMYLTKWLKCWCTLVTVGHLKPSTTSGGEQVVYVRLTQPPLSEWAAVFETIGFRNVDNRVLICKNGPSFYT